MDGNFKVAPVIEDKDASLDGDASKKNMSKKELKKKKHARALIKAGMGNTSGNKYNSGFEVFPRPLLVTWMTVSMTAKMRIATAMAMPRPSLLVR